MSHPPSDPSLFTRLHQASLLDHFVRGRLFQVIREEPGIHFAEIRRKAGFANGSTSHHLRILEQGGYIRVVIDGARTRFYPTGRPLGEAADRLCDADRALLAVVADTPGLSQADLAHRVNRSPSAVSRSVSRLASLGLVTTAHGDRFVHVFPRPGEAAVTALMPSWADEGA